jgi:hypothetical protein
VLDSITLKFTENPDIALPTKGITIFVGPNNAGKSLVLREIEQALSVHPFPSGLKILGDYEVQWPSLDELRDSLKKFDRFREPGQPEGHVALGRINPNGGMESGGINEARLFNIATTKTDKRWWATQFLRWGLLRLDGRSRFNLTSDQEGGDLLQPPRNVLAHLFQSDDSRKRVRSLILDAFGLYFSIDPTNLGSLRIRLAQTPPPADEQSLNAVAREYFGGAEHIKNSSDGVQAFSGIVTAVLSGEFHTVLIDEPEAFLHPPLARKLGRSLASLATERSGSMLASTHSPDFLMGCIQASKDVRVVRLEYSHGKSRGRMVDPSQLERFFKRPLMRSANVVSGLFHDGVVITESDNDRAFYSEIYHRLTEVNSELPSILFINAQNKQTITDIMGPLRQFGVPAASIPDIDVLKDGGKTWTDWLTAAQLPSALHSGFAVQRAAVKAAFDASGKDMKRDGGVEALPVSDRLAANQLFDNLQDFGVFVVRGGELESWLKSLKVPGRKTDWTVAMLERLGSEPTAPEYVRPASGDVWDFMRGIAAWISAPSRKGTA